VEVQPNWFINRKAELSLVETVANRKGFRRSEKKSSHWLKQLSAKYILVLDADGW